MKRRASRGFTLVELLIVIVVIAILAAITIVAYGNVTEKARMASAEQFESDLHHQYGADAVGDWSFDDCSGSTVKDNTTGTSDTIIGTPNWITDTPTGKGCALHFSNSTRIETQVALNSNLYVKGAWVRVSSCANSINIISEAATAGASAAFYLATGCHLDAGNNNVWTSASSPNTIDDGKWHYVAVIWQPGSMRLYIDGSQVAQAAVATLSPTGNVAIGSNSNGNFFNGDIDNPFVATE